MPAASVVTITEHAASYWIKTTDAGAPMAMRCDSEWHDEHTARTFVRMIAGGFDAKRSRADVRRKWTQIATR